MRLDYDASYKRMFAFPEMVRALARGYLPGDWDAAVRWDTLELRPPHLVGSTLEKRDNDLLWRLTHREGSEMHLYLMIESQPAVDLDLAVRLNSYMALFTANDWAHRASDKPWRVPAVAPIVLYFGNRPWNAAVEVSTQREWSLEEGEVYGQRTKYALVSARDAPQLPDGEPNLADALFRLVRAQDSEAAASAGDWMQRALEEAGNPNLAATLVDWFNGVWSKTRPQGAEARPVAEFKEVPKMMENHFDSWADTWIAKGEKRGELKGRKQLLLRMVRERYGDGAGTEIAPTLDAIESSQTLDDIGVWIVTAGTADDFVARVLAL